MRDLPMPTLPLADLLGAATPRRSLHRRSRLGEEDGEAVLAVAWARNESEVREAQRLRHLVFVEEMGARLTPLRGTPAGHDADAFDAHCEHLLLRAQSPDGRPGPVVGTYRVMTPSGARQAGGLYTETEFDLSSLEPLRSTMVELGRSCVHPAWRSGAAILTLWGALGAFMQRNGLAAMVGCASVSMRDGGHVAASLWETLRRTHLAPAEWRATPRLALPVDELDQTLPVEAPALIKGYLRCGAQLLGPPAWDPDFNTADLPMFMRIDALPSRYQRHFLDAAAA